MIFEKGNNSLILFCYDDVYIFCHLAHLFLTVGKGNPEATEIRHKFAVI